MNAEFRLREPVAHSWWLCVVLWAFLGAPLLTVSTTSCFQALTNLCLSLFVPPAVSFFILWVAPSCVFFGYEAFSKASPGSKRPGCGARARLTGAGLARPELLGWMIWFAGTIVAVNSAFSATPDSSTYVAILNSASPDFARASAIGLIVIFFTQMLRHYQSTVDRLHDAAGKAHEAATNARQAVDASAKALPEIRDATERSLAAFRAVHADLKTRQYSEMIAKLLTDRDQVPEELVYVVAHLYEKIAEHTGQLHDELRATVEDPFQFLVFASLYASYLETESLTFFSDPTTETPAPGTGSCQFATRFAHYADAVARIVELLTGLDSNRYEYYTILNLRPKRFFNLRDGTTDLGWSTKFVNGFCRGHFTDRIPYTRLFLASDEGDPRRWQLPSYDEVSEDLDSRILCGGDRLPVLWEEGDRGSALDVRIRECATNDLHLKAPAYIIARKRDTALDTVVAGLRNPDLQLRLIREVLPEYHNPSIPPRILAFSGSAKCEAFFGEHLPHDLFAVWDKRPESLGWCLWIGSLSSPGEPNAATLVFATRDARNVLKGLTWNALERSLDVLFNKRNGATLMKNAGITLRGLDEKEIVV